MTHWNYRVMQFTEGPETWRAIHEVYYDDDDKPISYTADPAVVMWDVSEDPVSTPTNELLHMAEAIDKPILTPADFGVTDE